MVLVTYDKEGNTFYVRVNRNPKRIVKTIGLGNDHFLDIDELGRIAGMEIIGAENPEEIHEVVRRTEEIEILS